MANSWLRLWHDMPNDPKWRTISRMSKQPVATVQAVYIHLLVSASQNVTRGHVDITEEDLASSLDVTEEEILSILDAMQGRVLDGDYISGWERRQPEKDDSGSHRSKTKNNYIYYVVATNSDVVKIGVSSNPWSRLKEINSDSTGQFELFATMRITTRSSEPFTTYLNESHKGDDWFYKTEALNLLMNKVKLKDVKTEQECIEFLSSLPVDAFKLLRSNDVVDVATTYKDTDKDTDKELKDPPLNPPEGKTGKNKFDPLSVELPEWLSPELWCEWVEYRVALRKPIKTMQGANGSIRELDNYREAGFTPEQVIRHSIAREYQGLYAPQTNTNRGRDINQISQPNKSIPKGFRG